ncbi:MAG: penicillin-binding protein activator LpoB [bacterium]|nr:penicillin-binding protein activator LpoB [bacterium]
MKHLIKMTLMLLVVTALLVGGCSKTQVTRVDTDTTIDLSGHWNDTDSRMVSETMVGDCLNAPWVNQHAMAKSKRPVIIVGSIRNKTTDHIATEIFVKDLERACINSGMIDVVASADERGELRGERLDQRANATPETIKQMGRELGADYMLIGSINQQDDAAGNDKVIFFSTDLELIDIQSNRKVWMGNEKIKKVRQQGRYKG